MTQLGFVGPLRWMEAALRAVRIVHDSVAAPDNDVILDFDCGTGARAAMRFAWRNFPLHAVIHCIASLLMVLAAMIWGWVVGAWLGGRPLSGISEPLAGPLWPTLVLLAVEVIAGAAVLLNEIDLRRRYMRGISLRLSRVGSVPPSAAASFDRVRGRDLLVLADIALTGPSLVVGLIACIGGTGFIGAVFGGKVLAMLLSLSLAAALAAWLARKGADVASKVVEAAGDRIALLSQWKTSGKWLLSWGIATNSLERLDKAAQEEARLLNADSLIRSVETYVGTFGVILPFAGAFLAAVFLGQSMDGLLSFAWAGLPIVGAFLGLSRNYADCVQVSEILRNAREGLPGGLPFDEPRPGITEIVLDEASDIYDGSLALNIDPMSRHSSAALKGLIADLGLNDLGDRSLEHWLEGGGSNVSAGQKLRILIARAYSEAQPLGCPVQIRDSLASLDLVNVARARDAATARNIKVLWSEAAEERLAIAANAPGAKEHCEEVASNDLVPLDLRAGDVSHEEPGKTPFLAASIHENLPAFAWMYLFPAAAVAWLTKSASQSEVDLTLNLALQTLLLAAAALAMAIGVNFFVERAIRSAAVKNHTQMLRRVSVFSPSDFFDRLSRDYSTVVGRLTYYLNDVAWILACAIVSLATLVYGLGAQGALVALTTSCACLAIWQLLSPRVIRAREALPKGQLGVDPVPWTVSGLIFKPSGLSRQHAEGHARGH